MSNTTNETDTTINPTTDKAYSSDNNTPDKAYSSDNNTTDKSDKNEKEQYVPTEDNLELHSLKFKDRQKAKFEKLKSNMEGMSKPEKTKYILSYYKWKIVFALLLLFCAISIPLTIYKNTKPVALSYMIINCEEPKNINTAFIDDYLETFNITGRYKIVEDKDVHFDKDTYLEEYYQNQNDSDYTKIPMMCFNGYYDIIITDTKGAIYCGMQEISVPLKSYLPADIYELVSDRVFETENYNGVVEPFAIDISDTDFAKGLNLGYDDVYLAFPGTTEENYNNAKRMLNYIFGFDLYIPEWK